MKYKLPSSLALALAAVISTSSASDHITFDWVEIGNPGNAHKAPGNYATAWDNGTASVINNDGVGKVDYTYSMARDKVTIAQYTKFLNAKAKLLPANPSDYYIYWDGYALDTYHLWNPRMSINTWQNHAGITRSGAGSLADPFTYTYYITTRTGPVGGPFEYTTTVGAGGNRPVTFVSWTDAARFANWIHNGQVADTIVASVFTPGSSTEDGAYTMNGITGGTGGFFPFYSPDPNIPGKEIEVPKLNGGATVRVPSGDEWVKAAYYDPTMVNADLSVGGYWLLGNKSNAFPFDNNNVGDAGAVNFRAGDFATTPGDNTHDLAVNCLTDVGAYGTGSRSAYGINDMAGLTWDWNDSMGALLANRNQPARRQGSWFSNLTAGNNQIYQPRQSSSPSSNIQASNAAHAENPWIGFRLAIPPAAPEIAIEQNAVDIPAYVLDWVALGNPNPNATVNFGSVALGSDTSLIFTIKNTGNAALILSGTPLVAVSGTDAADFTVTANPVSPVAAAGSTTFTVNFAPLGMVEGARTATLTIANDDWDESSFTFTVNGTSEAASSSPYEDWAGAGVLFGADANGDGVSNGLAFLLGAVGPNDSALDKLPTVSEIDGNLIMSFDCLPVAARGGATLKVVHTNSLGSWSPTTGVVPDDTNAEPDNHVTFVVGAGPEGPPALKSVTATIGSAAADGAGKLFGRLEATE